MDFLKRHYEKVILLGLFVLFIVLMFLVLDVIAQSRELDKTELRLPRGKNYTKMAALDTPGVLLDKTKLIWESSVSREQSVNYSDLIHVFKIAECPYCREKDQNKIALIPLTEFSSALNPKGKCSFCRTHLPVPPVFSNCWMQRRSNPTLPTPPPPQRSAVTLTSKTYASPTFPRKS